MYFPTIIMWSEHKVEVDQPVSINQSARQESVLLLRKNLAIIETKLRVGNSCKQF